MRDSKIENGFEKKTERLDVRLSVQKKEAFTEACESQGDTPSQAVRRFVNSYIRRASRDDMGNALRVFAKPKPVLIMGGVAALLGVAAYLSPIIKGQSAQMTAEQLFAYYDYDKSGILEPLEISSNDYHLHRVLNIDGQAGISPQEFITKATMKWAFVNPDNYTVVDEEKTRGKHVRVQRTMSTKLPEGALIPTGNPDKPFLTVDEFMALDQPWNGVQKGPLKIDARTLPDADGVTVPPKAPDYFVIFDLSNPSSVQLDVLEHKSLAQFSKSMIFSRGVDWVEGADKPHFVMGQGADAWEKLAKSN